MFILCVLIQLFVVGFCYGQESTHIITVKMQAEFVVMNDAITKAITAGKYSRKDCG